MDRLVDHYRQIFCDKYNRDVRFSDKAMEVLRSYRWPGNVRELDRLVDIVVQTADDSGIVAPDDLLRFLALPRPTIKTEDVIEAIKLCNGNKSSAATLLRISRSTLYRLLRQKCR